MSALAQVGQWTQDHPIITIATASAVAVASGTFALRKMKAVSSSERRKFSAGTIAAVFAFIVCNSVSLNTSYRFTQDGLGMQGTAERLLSCAAFESLIAMCVLGARERMDGETKSPGWYGSAVWIFAALSSVPAWHEGGGFTTGTVVRVVVGSFGSALAAHSALGLELRHRTGAESQSPMAQIARDLRERLMARLGLAHRGRTAQQIAQARALDKAVDLADEYHRLSKDDKGKKKGTRLARRLAKWQDRAGIATNDDQRQLYRARVAQRQFSTELQITAQESPWHTGGTSDEAEAAVAKLEDRIRHIEALAEEAEAAVAAQIGTSLGTHVPGPRAGESAGADEGTGQEAEEVETEPRKAAAARQGQPRVTARLPETDEVDDEHQRTEDERPKPPRDLRSYPTKRAALEALYAVRIAKDDPRTTNAIAEELRAELAEAGITLDRGAANRYVAELRPTPTQDEDEPEQASADQLVTA